MKSIEARTGKTVIFKDLAFQAINYVTDDFLASVTNTFIVRHPDLVIGSLKRLKPDFTEEELGFVPLGEMFDRVAALGQCQIIVEGEVFRAAPDPVLQAYCALVGLPFESRMLHWKDGRIRRWEPHEIESQAKWHSTLEASIGIEPPSGNHSPPAFYLGDMYDLALKIYHRMSANALSPGSAVALCR